MCPYAGKAKILFSSESKALRYITWNAEEITATNGYCPTRAYYCSACGGWHVTSHEKKYRPSRWRISPSKFEPDPLCGITSGIARMQCMLHNGEFDLCYDTLQETTSSFLNLPEKERYDKQGKETKRMLLSIVERLGNAMISAA